MKITFEITSITPRDNDNVVAVLKPVIETVKRVFEKDTDNQITNAAAKAIRDSYEALEAIDTTAMDEGELTQHTTDLEAAKAAYDNLEQRSILIGDNANMWDKTPGARLQIYVDNEAKKNALQVGDKYEVTITKKP